MSYIGAKRKAMKAKKTLLERITLRIKKSKDNSFILSDFNDFKSEYDYDQVLRVLRILVKKGTLIKIGRGIYAKTRTFNNGLVAPNGAIGDLATEALQKLGVKTDKSTYWREYNANLSTQVPTGRVIAVNKRVRRNIGFNGFNVSFEQINGAYKNRWYNKNTARA